MSNVFVTILEPSGKLSDIKRLKDSFFSLVSLNCSNDILVDFKVSKLTNKTLRKTYCHIMQTAR